MQGAARYGRNGENPCPAKVRNENKEKYNIHKYENDRHNNLIN
jgi:hypothetical protein